MSILTKPIKIGSQQLKNRLIMAPMQQYKGTKEGFATDYHVRHYAERAKSGLGLVIVESTAVSEDGRLFQNDIGIFTDDHIRPLGAVVDAVHQLDRPIFIQLCHGGRKSSPENKGKMIAPSKLAFDENYGVPNEMTVAEIKMVIEKFAEAARRSVEAGFDGIEIHAAHGYLIHQFLSPLANTRNDTYGGSLENRTQFLKEVLQAVREAVGDVYPVQIRFSASDYEENGLHPENIGEVLQLLTPIKMDAVHISSGGVLPIRPPNVFPGYQVMFAEEIKKSTSLPIIAVGLIHTKELAEEILTEKRADCIAIGSPLLDDPDFVKPWIM